MWMKMTFFEVNDLEMLKKVCEFSNDEVRPYKDFNFSKIFFESWYKIWFYDEKWIWLLTWVSREKWKEIWYREIKDFNFLK